MAYKICCNLTPVFAPSIVRIDDDRNLAATELWRKFLSPARARTAGGSDKRKLAGSFNVLLPFHIYDFFGRKHLRQVVENLRNALNIPNPSPIPIGATQSESFWLVTNLLVYQFAVRVCIGI